jgi:hypothetical protein
MSLRLSLVTVLLALVGLHSSEKVDRPPNSDASPDASELQVAPHRDALPYGMIYRYDWAKEIISWQEGEWNCSNGFEVLAFREYKTNYWYEFREQILSGLKSRRDFCFSRLEMEIQSELGAMSESIREHFKLFAELDQRECSSAPGSLCLIFGTQNMVISKLLRLSGSHSPKDAKLARGFVSACKEMAGHAPLATIRAKYEEVTPSSTKPYYSHIRFYDFCRKLVDLDLSAREIDDVLNLLVEVRGLGEILDKVLVSDQSREDPEPMWSKMADSDRKRSVAKAAYQFALKNSEYPIFGNELRTLKFRCRESIMRTAHFGYMQRNMSDLLDLKRGGKHNIERNLRYLEACVQVLKLEGKDINEVAGKWLI